MKVLFLFACILCGCHTPSVKLHPVEDDSQYCGLAAEHLGMLCQQDLKANEYCCQVSRPTKKGKTFEQLCREKEFNGINFNAQCLSEVSVCGDIDACTGSK